MSNMSFERGGEEDKNKASVSSASSTASTPPHSSGATAVETDPALDQPTIPTDPMLHVQYPIRGPMPHQFYQAPPPPQQLPLQSSPSDSMHLARPHRAATHQQSNARGNGEDDDDYEDHRYSGVANGSLHPSNMRGAVVNGDAELEEEARRRFAYASQMPSAYPIPFQSGQHDPRLVASQAGGLSGPSLLLSQASAVPLTTTSTPASYMNGNVSSLNDSVNVGPMIDSNAVPTGNKRKRDDKSAGTAPLPSSTTGLGSYPKMRLANNGSKVKVKPGSKAAAIEALAVAEAATQAVLDSVTPPSTSQAPRSQASGSAHGSGGEEGDDADAGELEPPTTSTMDMNGGVIPEGAQEINPDGSITMNGMRLPPIMQVEKQHVTTTATQAASASRRRNEAQFHCPVPGCGSTFTRRFNLRGHLRSHTEERPFQCEWPGCGKSFARKHDCNRHMTLHSTMAAQHTCAGCGKSFSRTDALNRHLRSEGGAACKRASAAQNRAAMQAQIANQPAGATHGSGQGMYSHAPPEQQAQYAQLQQSHALSHASGSRSPMPLEQTQNIGSDLESSNVLQQPVL